MGGYMMQLQDFSVNDGDGIRTVVFMAGCPLHCAWCANPEGQTMCNPMTEWMETEAVVRALRRQAIFFRQSGGGVTFSGGEATMQLEFLRELAGALYDEGFSLAIETCGYFEFEALRSVLEKMDTIFMDFKHPDDAAHRRWTGVGNGRIKENICRADACGWPVVVRVPVIGGVNGDDQTMTQIFDFFTDNHLHAALELLPYQRYGDSKYEALGRPLPDAAFDAPSETNLARWKAMARARGIEVVSYR